MAGYKALIVTTNEQLSLRVGELLNKSGVSIDSVASLEIARENGLAGLDIFFMDASLNTEGNGIMAKRKIALSQRGDLIKCPDMDEVAYVGDLSQMAIDYYLRAYCGKPGSTGYSAPHFVDAHIERISVR